MNSPTRAQSFLVALALLTRLGPSNLVKSSDLARSQAYFAAVGALLGFLYCIFIYILQCIGISSGWILAWAYIALDMWITRGLHYDGLADITDAVGSGATDEKFWNIVHDSRLGAFGAIALIMVISAQLIGIQDLIQQEQWYVLIIAPIFGRILCVLFANVVLPRDPNSLGGKVCTPQNNSLCIIHILLSICILLPLGFSTTLGVLLFSAIFFYALKNMAQKHGGCNGDFFGTVIMGGQCIILLLC